MDEGAASPRKLCEGKTKIVWETTNPHTVEIESKEDITAGDGARHDVLAGKAVLATQTTCNVFRYLRLRGVGPLAFICQLDQTRFLAERCDMIALEVVVRREAHGSYLKRNPGVARGTCFAEPICECFLKTSGRVWEGYELPCDDPLMQFRDDGAVELYLPNKPLDQQEPFLVLTEYPLSDRMGDLLTLMNLAPRVFLALEEAWARLGRRLADFKLEFGRNHRGKLRLADVIDNDSWRVLEDDEYIDKQPYRDGAGLEDTLAKYRHVAELTSRFLEQSVL